MQFLGRTAPGVGPEGRGGQAFPVIEIGACRIHGVGVADRYGLGHLVGADNNGFSIYGCFSPVPVHLLICDSEVLQLTFLHFSDGSEAFLPAGHESCSDVIKKEPDRAAPDREVAVEWPGGHNILLFVGLVKGPLSETFADILLVTGMDVIRSADIGSDCHPGVGKIEGLGLGLPELGPAIATRGLGVWLLEVGELDPIKGKLVIPEGPPPPFTRACFLW